LLYDITARAKADGHSGNTCHVMATYCWCVMSLLVHQLLDTKKTQLALLLHARITGCQLSCCLTVHWLVTVFSDIASPFFQMLYCSKYYQCINCLVNTPTKDVGFEGLIAVIMKSCVFCDITPCSPLKVSWCFRGTCCFHLQGQRISQARNQHEAGSKQLCLSFYP
jgi:hypothetical protein